MMLTFLSSHVLPRSVCAVHARLLRRAASQRLAARDNAGGSGSRAMGLKTTTSGEVPSDLLVRAMRCEPNTSSLHARSRHRLGGLSTRP